MLLVYGLIGIGIFLILFILFFKIMKRLLALVAVLIFFIIISTLVVGYIVYTDMQVIDSNFANSTNLYLFEEQGEIKYGFLAKGFGLVDKEMLTEYEIGDLQEYYAVGDLDNLVGNYYKLILFKKEEYENKNQTELHEYFDDQFLQNGPALIFKGVRDGDVLIYPETPFFKVAKFMPSFIADRMRMFGEN